MSKLFKYDFLWRDIKTFRITKIFVCVIISFLYFPAFAVCHSDTLSGAVSLIAKRASIMKEVAASKWYNAPDHQAVAYSAKQEISVLNHAYNVAKENKLNPLSIMIFSQIQMDISKQIETYWINYWNNPKTPPQNKPSKQSIESLDKLRAEIGKIDTSLYPELKSSMQHIRQCSIKQVIPIFDNAFSDIAGIPKKPDYLDMFAQSFKSIFFNI